MMATVGQAVRTERGILAGTEPSRCEGLWEQGAWDLAELQEARGMAELGDGRPGGAGYPWLVSWVNGSKEGAIPLSFPG